MKKQTWLIGGVTLALGLMTTSAINTAIAQPDPNETAKAANPENRKPGAGRRADRAGNRRRGDNEARQQRLLEDDLKALETVAGKPLTDEQKQQVKEALTQREAAVQKATETYRDQLAKLAGVTSDELEFQMRQMRRMNGGGGRRGGREGGAREGGGRRRGGRQGADQQTPQAAPAQPGVVQPGAETPNPGG